MTTFKDIMNGLRQLDLGESCPVIVHASLSSLDEVRGGPEAALGAIRSVFHSVIMPTFTYKTMLIPETGPENNGIRYGSGKDLNRMAEFFHYDLPADPTMGILPETLRKTDGAVRSIHPILSFSGVNVNPILAAQTLADPLAPIGRLADQDGWVLLIGVDCTVNTAIHYAEQLAGRKTFVRWALTCNNAVECPGYPGCSDGFRAVEADLEPVTRLNKVNTATLKAMPLKPMFEILAARLRQDPLAYLCSRPDCERCGAVRTALVPKPAAAAPGFDAAGPAVG